VTASAGPPQPIRVGGNVQAAKLIVQTPPEYPAELQQAGIESSVTIKAFISTTGEPTNLEVISPGGDPRLVRAALDAVRQCRYQPARLNGEPVAIDTQITVDFRLAP
jgi:protein TonB